MGKTNDIADAMKTLVTAQRAQKTAAAAASASFTSIMGGVGVNMISAQNITDLNTAQTNWDAATAAYDAAVQVANQAIQASLGPQ